MGMFLPPFVRRESSGCRFNSKESLIEVVRLGDVNCLAKGVAIKTHAIVNNADHDERKHKRVEWANARAGVIKSRKRHPHHEVIASQAAHRVKHQPIDRYGYNRPKLLEQSLGVPPLRPLANELTRPLH